MNNAKVVEGIQVIGIKRFPERMENGLERLVKPRCEEYASDDMCVADIPGRMYRLMVIRVAVINVGSWIRHITSSNNSLLGINIMSR
ncbi:hypothetical protein AMS69_17880 [Haloarcula rubripromontorii]|uniref:Uncharacterized protein n=1 Tax=Haloarcula rubripromontorii TaxID=1705562 RepID=A0A0M9AIZ4_9EURY|nr:hypothetical protein AMS69_17880 [Haloarcula rubripromontorii]